MGRKLLPNALLSSCIMNDSFIAINSHDAQTFNGYLSLPPTGTGPGLILIQEIWGVNEHIRAVADQYAMDGYVVLAPDVYWRQQVGVDLGYDAAGTQLARQYMTALDFPSAVNDLVSAAQALRQRPEVQGKVGTIGYCMGGRLGFALAAQGAVDATVCYYGGGIQNMLALAPKVSGPILFHYAELDTHIPPEAVQAVRQAFSGRPNAQIHTYANVEHGFNCWRRPVYKQQAAALARGRTLQWLSDTLA